MGLFGRKGDEDGEDHSRLALFGSRSKSKSPAPPSNNPYAQPPGPAAGNLYAQAKAKAYGYGDYTPGPQQGQAAGGYGNNPYGTQSTDPYGGDRYGASGMNKSPYGGPPEDNARGGYGANRSGAPSGYGADRYGGSATAATAQGGGNRYGGGAGSGGGYGGMGGDSYAQQDEDRNALFGGAKERAQQQQPSAYGGAPPGYESGDHQSGGYGDSSQGYGTTYEDKQLTAEEEEEEDVKATKQQMRFLKQSDVASTRNALRIAAQAEETGRDTLARLGAQGEHIHNTEKALDLSQNQIRTADDKTRELKKLNKSMFAMHVGNPMTSASRRRERDEAIIDRHLEERNQREATRMAAYQTDQRMQKNFKDMDNAGGSGGRQERNLAERAKYQFEADSEDEQMEDEIDSNLDALSGAAGRLNALARATGQEVDQQNKHLDGIAVKVCFRLTLTSSILMKDALTLFLERSCGPWYCDWSGQAGPHSLMVELRSFPYMHIGVELSQLGSKPQNVSRPSHEVYDRLHECYRVLACRPPPRSTIWIVY